MKFGYVRFSQDDPNLDLQIDALKTYGVDEIYEEKALGSMRVRPQLTDLLGKLRAGDTLVIWRLDRLGRTIKQLLELAEDFDKRGICLVSTTEKFDTKTPDGRFAFRMFCAISQMEREVLSERTTIGMKAAKKRGSSVGRKPKDIKSIEKALRMYFTDESSIHEICESTGVSKTTIYKYIRDYQEKEGKETLDDKKRTGSNEGFN